ncbi:MAG: hypothetical protein H7834_08275 [Magnetococcus sp. YQC-9]
MMNNYSEVSRNANVLDKKIDYCSVGAHPNNLAQKETVFSLSVFFLSCSIIAPKIGVIDLPVAWLLLLVLFNILIVRRYCYYINRNMLLLIIMWALLFILASTTKLVYGSVAEVVLLKPLRQIILLVLLSMYWLTNKSLNIKSALAAIFVAAVLNGIVIMAQYGLEAAGLSDEWLIMPGFDKNVNVMYRKPGLTAGYPTAGLLALIGFFSGLLLYTVIRKRIVLVGLMIITLSISVTSRLAFYLFIVSSILVIFLNIQRPEVWKILMMMVLPLFVVVVVLIEMDIVHHDTINVMYELFIRFSETGELSTESSDALLESWSFNIKSVSTLLVGNGLHAKNDFMQTVDAGYQINMFGAGIPFSIIYYLIFLMYMQIIYKASINKNYRLFVIFAVIILLVFEYKGAVIFSRVVGDCIVILVIASLYSRNKRQDSNFF